MRNRRQGSRRCNRCSPHLYFPNAPVIKRTDLIPSHQSLAHGSRRSHVGYNTRQLDRCVTVAILWQPENLDVSRPQRRGAIDRVTPRVQFFSVTTYGVYPSRNRIPSGSDPIPGPNRSERVHNQTDPGPVRNAVQHRCRWRTGTPDFDKLAPSVCSHRYGGRASHGATHGQPRSPGIYQSLCQ